MSEVSSLMSSKTRLEESLAALSASSSAEQKPAAVEALWMAEPVESGSLSMSEVVQNAMSSQLAPLKLFNPYQAEWICMTNK